MSMSRQIIYLSNSHTKRSGLILRHYKTRLIALKYESYQGVMAVRTASVEHSQTSRVEGVVSPSQFFEQARAGVEPFISTDSMI